jgi:trans-aconitate 2-methyltransferase
MVDWNPAAYMSFSRERTQPIIDLVAHLQQLAPKKAADLGCGPGNSTAILRQAFPQAQITGVDSSPAMISRAKAVLPGVTFLENDAAAWRPGPEIDLVFSNALFQWVPDHHQVIREILKALRPGAALAIQMPDNLGEPSHRLMAEVAGSGPWNGKLRQASMARSQLLTPSGYHDLLSPLCSTLEIWRTTYHHQLNGHQGIVDMLSTTGLKPFLDPLPAEERAQYLSAYVIAIAPHYPILGDGSVLYPFPRLFLKAIRGDT